MSPTLSIEDPLARKLIREHVADRVLTYLSSKFGIAMTMHNDYPNESMKLIWESVEIELGAIDQMDKVIVEFGGAMDRSGVRHFIRQIDFHEQGTIFTRNGICIRVNVVLFPGPHKISIDYKGWK